MGGRGEGEEQMNEQTGRWKGKRTIPLLFKWFGDKTMFSEFPLDQFAELRNSLLSGYRDMSKVIQNNTAKWKDLKVNLIKLFAEVKKILCGGILYGLSVETRF